MNWNLFIDDERDVEDVTWAPLQIQEKYRNGDWVVCRNHFEVFEKVYDFGMPMFISFDHDLGEGVWTGHDIVKELVDIDMNTIDCRNKFPEYFDYYVHSKNPIGKANIEGYINSYFKAKARAVEVPFDQTRSDELYNAAMEDDGTGDITVGKMK